MKLYPVGKFIIALNDDHKLPDIHRDHPLYDRVHMSVAADVLNLVEGVVLDIGANIGDTAAAFASVSNKKIICFEGEASYFSFLSDNVSRMGANIVAVNSFIDTDSFSGRNYSYVSESGTGKFLQKQPESDVEKRENFITLDHALSDYVGDDKVAIFKTDTDGFDLAILNDFISQRDAVLFFEYDVIITLGTNKANRWYSFFEQLDNRGYTAIFFDNFGTPLLVCETGLRAAAENLHRYCHAQRALRTNRMYYNDVWAFPPEQKSAFDAVVANLRKTVMIDHGV